MCATSFPGTHSCKTSFVDCFSHLLFFLRNTNTQGELVLFLTLARRNGIGKGHAQLGSLYPLPTLDALYMRVALRW